MHVYNAWYALHPLVLGIACSATRSYDGRLIISIFTRNSYRRIIAGKAPQLRTSEESITLSQELIAKQLFFTAIETQEIKDVQIQN